MSKTDISILSLGDKFVDLRDSISGDAYNFSWVRPLLQVQYLAIHHSATSDLQTPEQIAQTHINNNGWGGIGYHFLIDKDGFVYYVGDISTARANVANLNEQVLGICLIGNFIQGNFPTNEQIDSAHKLCNFFINEYPDLENVNSWDKVRGHKELPSQSTICPGDDWSVWRINIVEGISEDISKVDAFLENTNNTEMLESQVSNLQASLASVNQQLIFLQETLLERDKEINKLKLEKNTTPIIQTTSDNEKNDTTLTIIGALIKLYKFLSLPREVFANLS